MNGGVHIIHNKQMINLISIFYLFQNGFFILSMQINQTLQFNIPGHLYGHTVNIASGCVSPEPAQILSILEF